MRWMLESLQLRLTLDATDNLGGTPTMASSCNNKNGAVYCIYDTSIYYVQASQLRSCASNVSDD